MTHRPSGCLKNRVAPLRLHKGEAVALECGASRLGREATEPCVIDGIRLDGHRQQRLLADLHLWRWLHRDRRSAFLEVLDNQVYSVLEILKGLLRGVASGMCGGEDGHIGAPDGLLIWLIRPLVLRKNHLEDVTFHPVTFSHRDVGIARHRGEVY